MSLVMSVSINRGYGIDGHALVRRFASQRLGERDDRALLAA